ncbi:MAG: hypothetical protein U9R75_11090 [Candidatus Thermoplasmatota archaeon]|nr:hypothetical protein [Candidatus Thermoplasmatota archaeon]
MKQHLLIMMIAIVGAAAFAGCLGGDDGEEEVWTITINGMEFLKSEIFSDHDLHEVTDSSGDTYEGAYLEELLEDAGVSDLSEFTFRITASDGWMKEVTHLDIEKGILVEEDTKTIFPDLPGKYKIKDIASIEPLTDGDTITVNGQYWTWMQPFDIFDDVVLEDNESNECSGIRFSDMINYTALENPQEHNFTIKASDGYEKEVAWNDMMNGILLDDEDHKTFFPHLSSKYKIKDVMEITVV